MAYLRPCDVHEPSKGCSDDVVSGSFLVRAVASEPADGTVDQLRSDLE